MQGMIMNIRPIECASTTLYHFLTRIAGKITNIQNEEVIFSTENGKQKEVDNKGWLTRWSYSNMETINNKNIMWMKRFKQGPIDMDWYHVKICDNVTEKRNEKRENMSLCGLGLWPTSMGRGLKGFISHSIFLKSSL